MHRSTLRRYRFTRLIFGLALGLASASGAMAQDSFRAFWADAFSPGFKSTSEIDTMISRAVSGNYNAIIVEVLAYHDTGLGGHGAYWNSNSGMVPRASDISGGFDPLAYLVYQAHTAGLEAHAWIVPYRVCKTWPPSGNFYLSPHAEWLMVEQADIDGGPATIDGKYILDPGSPDAQDYITSIVVELVSDYDIDGINLDYIRYEQTDAGYPADLGYAKSSLSRFQNLTGYSGTPPPTGETSWNDFRRQTIDELVKRLRAEIPSITSNPQQPVRLTADLITFGDAPGSFQYSDAYTLHQNWRLWMEQGWLDAGIPMNYKREWYSSEDQWYRNWVDAAIGWRYDRHIFCGQGNYLNPKADSVTQLQYCLSAGADGVSNFSYAATADENMNGNPESDWSWYTYVASNVFTSPVATPDMPWRDPATATEGTLWGQVIDASTSEPIDGATVQVGALDAVQTDGNGYYVVTLVPAAGGGTLYDITAESDSCSQMTVSGVLALPGDIVRQDIDICQPPVPGDMDLDGDVDFDDFPQFLFCMQGPEFTYSGGSVCLRGDADDDSDVDVADFASFQILFGE